MEMNDFYLIKEKVLAKVYSFKSYFKINIEDFSLNLDITILKDDVFFCYIQIYPEYSEIITRNEIFNIANNDVGLEEYISQLIDEINKILSCVEPH